MKKLFPAAAMCLVLAFGLASCGGDSVSYDDYDLDEYIEVGDYKGLEAEPYKVSVTDDDVDDRIQSELEAAAENIELEPGQTVEDGDTVNIDYVGKVDGKKLDAASDEGYDLVIGSGNFIEGFESGLIGEKVGSKVVLDLTFPEDYQSEELQGKDAEFTVTINKAARAEVPEYDTAFIEEHTDYDTKAEYEEALRDQIYDEKETEAINDQKTDLWSQALDNTKVKKYPEKELDHYIESNSEQIDYMADQYDVSRDEMLAEYGFGDEDEFAAVNEDSSKLRVKQEMLIEYIADAEGIEYTDDEKEYFIQNMQSQGYDNDAVVQQTGRTMGDYAHIELLYEKVLDFIRDNAKGAA